MDWVGVLTAVATVVALWLLLKSEIKASEDRNNEAHGDLGHKIETVGNKVDGVREDVAYMRGVMDGERNARGRQPPIRPEDDPTR